MDEDRLAIQMNFGSRCGPCCRVKPVILEQLVTTIVSLWKRFFGACGQGRLGVTCPRVSAIGILFSNGSADGLMLGYLRVFSMR